jgi:hypothetical protein
MACYPRRRLTKTGYLACLVISAVLIGRTSRTSDGVPQDVLSSAQAASLHDTTRAVVDSAAVLAVRRMTTYLAGLPSYSVRLESTTDDAQAAEGILDALLELVEKQHGLSPWSERMYRLRTTSLLNKVKSGGIVGTGWVGDVECDHLAFHQGDVDWQLWVERGARPLPRRIAVTRRNAGARQEVVMLTWKLGSRVGAPAARVRTWSNRSRSVVRRS